jgi:uncharacterized protein YbjT (DUF2867 family)
MTTLVTGATGRIGSRFVPRLLDHGEEVLVLARDAERARLLGERGARVLVGDLREDDGTLRRALEGGRRGRPPRGGVPRRRGRGGDGREP